MKKKVTALCSVILAVAVCTAAFGVSGGVETNVTTATARVFYAENEESTTSGSFEDLVGDIVGGINSGSSGGLGDLVGGIGSGSYEGFGDVFGGIGDAIGGVGDALGGIGSGFGDIFGGLLGGGSSVPTTAAPVITTSADIGIIIPVPAATQSTTQVTVDFADESGAAGETVDYAQTSNPYTKPTDIFVAGDEHETIKWLQWIFIYSGYGLKDNGITGVLDEDTVAVIKKLQHENQLTVDGNVTEEVIKAAEVLYYQSILGEDVSAIEVPSQVTTSVNGTNPTTDSGVGNGIPVALLIIVLVIIWVLAIGGIILLFIFKKKKSKVSKEENKGTEEKTESKQIESKETISSIADLFEEAEKNSK